MSSIDSRIAKFFKTHLARNPIEPALMKPFDRAPEDQLTESFFSEPLAPRLTAEQFEIDLSSDEQIFKALTADIALLGSGLPPDLVRDLLKLRNDLGEVAQAPEISELIYIMY